jgi:predicted phage terminase large subunit-like protein
VGNDVGDTGPGDFAAIVVVGQDKAGYMYALDCFVAKAPPSVQVAEAFRLHERWGFKALYVEANGFQEALVEMYQDWQRRRFGNLILPVKGEHQSENKTLRIASLEPYVTNGTLRFNRALDSRLIEQLKYFPTTHDDGPDALQGAVSKLQKPQFSSGGVQMGGPSGRSRYTPRSNSKRPWVR